MRGPARGGHRWNAGPGRQASFAPGERLDERLQPLLDRVHSLFEPPDPVLQGKGWSFVHRLHDRKRSGKGSRGTSNGNGLPPPSTSGYPARMPRAPGPHRLVGAALVVEGCLIVAALLGGWLLRVRPLAMWQFGWVALATGVVATAPLLLGLVWSVRTRFEPLARLTRAVEDKVVPLFEGCTVAHLAAIALLAGIGEEMLFRGLTQTAAARPLGPWGGLAAASALFGLAHPITPLYALLAGLIGAYLGGLLMVTENLVVPTVVHALYDFVALLYVASLARRRSARAKTDQEMIT